MRTSGAKVFRACFGWQAAYFSTSFEEPTSVHFLQWQDFANCNMTSLSLPSPSFNSKVFSRFQTQQLGTLREFVSIIIDGIFSAWDFPLAMSKLLFFLRIKSEMWIFEFIFYRNELSTWPPRVLIKNFTNFAFSTQSVCQSHNNCNSHTVWEKVEQTFLFLLLFSPLIPGAWGRTRRLKFTSSRH